MTYCERCENIRWVCENHPENPWLGHHACNCGGAGMPCPLCNRADAVDTDDYPKMPDGYVPELARRKALQRSAVIGATRRVHEGLDQGEKPHASRDAARKDSFK